MVPVICHLKTAGNSEDPLRSCCLATTPDGEHSGHVSEANKHPQTSQDNNLLLDSFFESSQLKHDKTENSGNDIPSADTEEGEKFSSSCEIGQFQSSGSHIIAAPCSPTDKDQCVHGAYASNKYLSPESNCRKSGNRCVSDVVSGQSFTPFESIKHAHIPGILSDTFNNKKSHNTTDNNSENRSYALSENMAQSHKEESNIYFDNFSNTDTNGTMYEKGTSDLKLWRKMAQYSAPTSEMLTVEKVAMSEESKKTSHSDCCEFSRLRKDQVNAYQGHLRYHCLPESNDSDSNETCPEPNVDVKDSSEVLETIDMAEILLSTREHLKSGSHCHLKTRRFQCSVPECEKAFSQRGSLNRHMRQHLGIRPYSCPLCSMTFSRQYRVTEHMRVHQRSCDDPL